MTRRVRPLSTRLLPHARILSDPMAGAIRVAQESTKNSTFGIARVLNVDYEEMFVTLRIVGGQPDQFDKIPIPLTFPGAGTRHFLGAMPQIGDYCVVGFYSQSSNSPNGTKLPIILTWIAPSAFAGREWETIAAYTIDEADLGTVKERQILAGVQDRIRHKLRHMQPGNVAASSSQGSDFVLDEGVTLASRRGSEFRLRDQDQAAILRSLQSFQAFAGVRTYAGMVQRDALTLPTSMFSDGKEWAGDQQYKNGFPIKQSELPDSLEPEGQLTPARVFGRSLETAKKGYLGKQLFNIDANIDPYQFLRLGGFIDESGQRVAQSFNDTYGGKPVYRISVQNDGGVANGATSKTPTLTEYRMELSHDSDGRLPVTEQTDLFDVDKLPDVDPGTPGSANKTPFIEWVMGSVIGNDPFAKNSDILYGMPVEARIFSEDGTINPGLIATNAPLKEHAATLFKLNPLFGEVPTFWSVNKKAQMKAYFGGVASENSVEVATVGGFKMAVGGKFDFSPAGPVKLNPAKGDPVNNVGFEVDTGGAVKITGRGALKGNEDAVDGSNLPSVDIFGQTGVRIAGKKAVSLTGSSVEVAGSVFKANFGDLIDFKVANRFSLAAQDGVFSFAGKRTDTYAGPKMGLPTSGPLHESVYAPTLPGLVARRTTITQGDLEELLNLGSRKATVAVGNIRFEATTGQVIHVAGSNSTNLNTTGWDGDIGAGNMVLSASAGSASFNGITSVEIHSDGVAKVSGSIVRLEAPIVGPDQGPIICAGSLDPFTGLPFATFGIGAANHIVGS